MMLTVAHDTQTFTLSDEFFDASVLDSVYKDTWSDTRHSIQMLVYLTTDPFDTEYHIYPSATAVSTI